MWSKFIYHLCILFGLAGGLIELLKDNPGRMWAPIIVSMLASRWMWEDYKDED